jgi:hypothetical protein
MEQVPVYRAGFALHITLAVSITSQQIRGIDEYR